MLLNLNGVNESLHTLINYCSESLNELTIETFSGEIFSELRKPFKNVSVVRLSSGSWDCEANNVNISEIFPSVRQLNMEQSYTNSKCIDYYHFPHLDHIKFPMYSDASPHKMETKNKMYEHIFNLNTQLRSIHITDYNSNDILRVASKKLKNLESIELTTFCEYATDNDETFRFENVKKFYITSRMNELPNHPPFDSDQLEEMKIETRSNTINEKWIELIKKQQKLKILSILRRNTSKRNLLNWIPIVESLPELEVIKSNIEMSYGNHQNANEIVRLMRAKTNLKKIILIGMTQQEYDEFRNMIGSEWKIEGDLPKPKSRGDITFVCRENNA